MKRTGLTEITLSSVSEGTYGRAIAQEVNCRLPTAAARVRSQLRSCGVCGGQSGIGTGFLLVLRFPLPVIIPPNAPYSSSEAGTVGQLVVDSVSPHPKGLKELKLGFLWACIVTRPRAGDEGISSSIPG
jgi:hypothetical protein